MRKKRRRRRLYVFSARAEQRVLAILYTRLLLLLHERRENYCGARAVNEGRSRFFFFSSCGSRGCDFFFFFCGKSRIFLCSSFNVTHGRISVESQPVNVIKVITVVTIVHI